MTAPKPVRALISSGLWVEFSMPETGTLECRWTPETPRHLSRGQLRRYRRVRDAFIAKLAGPGRKALVIEL